MPSGQYSYIDISALEAIRSRFAAGDAMAILTPALDEVLWANGAGAALFGYSDIGSIIGAEPQIGLAAKRQIMATSGYPRIGKERAITVRLASGLMSRAVPFVASDIALPDGEDAILLAVPAPAAAWRSPSETAGRAIAGLDQDGQYAAIVDAEGKVVTASSGFDALGIGADVLGALAAEVRGERLVKRMIEAKSAFLPAGFVRLTDDPATHLLVVIDEAVPEEDAPPEASADVGPSSAAEAPVAGAASNAAVATLPAADATEAESSTAGKAREQAEAIPAEMPTAANAEGGADAGPTAVPEPGATDTTADSGTTEPTAETQPAAGTRGGPGHHDSWHFAGEEQASSEPGAAMANEADDTEMAAAGTEAGDEKIAQPGRSPTDGKVPATAIDRSAAPVRFVWKTDAEGRFSEISADLAKAVGRPAADLIGESFRDAAKRLGIDAGGEIAGLLERRDTWSGRSVLWPVAGTDLRIPVDLAALPAYDRNRQFTGFRGFGVARAADAVIDPQATGLALLKSTAGEPIAAEGTAVPPESADAEMQEGSAPAGDPFQGEVPILSIVPKQDRRVSDKVIRLAEHRPPTNEKGLSAGERNAFREIGDRLKKESGAPTEVPVEPALHADNDREPGAAQTELPGGEAGGGEAETPQPAEEPQAAGPLEPPDATSTADALAEFTETAELAGEAAAGSDEAGMPEGALAEQPQASDDHREAPAESGALPAGDQAETALVKPEAATADAAGPEVEAETATEARAETVADVPAVSGEASQPPAAGAAPADAAEGLKPDYLPSAFALGSASAERAPVDTSILEQLPVPVLIHSGDELHYANREFLELTGYDAVEELEAAGGLGMLFGEPYPREEGETEPSRKLRLRTSEGLEYPVEAFLQSVPWGAGKSLLLSLRRSWRQPVSYPAAPAQVVQAPIDPDLEARVAEMRAIVDTATDGVMLISPDGTIRSISRAAEALFGFESAELAGKPFTSLFAIESQRAARDYLNGLSDNGVASVLNDGREVIGREAQGRFIPLFMTIGKLPNGSGYCAVVRDITQWKRAEEELTQARAQAERASSQKTDFLARVSHEIRTPLNAIIGFSELMLDEKFGPIGSDRYRDYLRDINRSGNHVLDLVNDLLDISKIEAGQQEMSYEAVSLNDTLGETVAMMQPQANRERVIIRSSFASRLPEVVADLRSVRQIALNLMSNAVRYTPAGGQVIVSTAYETSGDVVMRVRDTGVGMSQPEIEQALKPFKQINALKRARGDGTGLGLPLTKAMVEANRARFMINSTPGEGTLVEITFPSTRVLAD
jgi:PAS domain S-box-containing protein